MVYNETVQRIVEDAETQLAVQGSFGRTGPIYWNAAEQYVRMNCTARIIKQLQS